MRFSVKTYLLLLLFAGFASCELVMEMEIPEHEPRLVINSIFNSDSVWYVTVGTSADILDPPLYNSRFPVNPTVSITDEEGNVTTLNPLPPGTIITDNGGGIKFRGTTRPEPGMTYQFTVRADNFQEPVFATARSPIPVQVVSAWLDSANMIEPSNEFPASIPVEFTFEDPVGAGDYYYPSMYVIREYNYKDPATGEEKTDTYSFPLQLSATLPNADIIDLGGELDAFGDASFDGKRHTIKLYVLDYEQGLPGRNVGAQLYLNHASEDYFRYFNSLRLQQQSRDNPFAQPVQVYSNVEGGFGAVVGFTPTRWDFTN